MVVTGSLLAATMSLVQRAGRSTRILEKESKAFLGSRVMTIVALVWFTKAVSNVTAQLSKVEAMS